MVDTARPRHTHQKCDKLHRIEMPRTFSPVYEQEHDPGPKSRTLQKSQNRNPVNVSVKENEQLVRAVKQTGLCEQIVVFLVTDRRIGTRIEPAV